LLVTLTETLSVLVAVGEASVVRIVFMSDSHGCHDSLPLPPDGDIFIHAGDFTNKMDWKNLEAGEEYPKYR